MAYVVVIMWDGLVDALEVFADLQTAQDWFLAQLEQSDDFSTLRDPETGTLELSAVLATIEKAYNDSDDNTHLYGSRIYSREVRTS